MEAFDTKIKLGAVEWNQRLLDRIHQFNRVGLSNGISGVILYNLVLYHSSGNEKHLSICLELVNEVIEKLNGLEPNGLFLADLTETCYVIRLLIDEAIEEKKELRAILESLEELMIQLGLQYLSNNLLDPYTGGFYPVYYFVYHKINNELVRYSFEKLKEKSFTNQKPCLFHTEFSEDFIYISITHGLSFFLRLMCDDQYIQDQSETKKKLIEFWNKKIISQLKEPQKEQAWFPEYFHGDYKTSICLAYGDLGTLWSLKIASERIKNLNTNQLILHASIETAKRAISKSHKIVDNSLLYGSSGILMYYHHLYKLSNETIFSEAELVFGNQTKANLICELDQLNEEKLNPNRYCMMEGLTGAISCYLLWSKQNDFISKLYFPFYIT